MLEGLFERLHMMLIAFIGFAMLPPYWTIFKKAGFRPWLSILIMIPVVGIFALYYFAFTKWPNNSK
jgi:hypothetical protein